MFPFLYYIILVVFILFKDRRSNFSSIPCGFPEWHFSVRCFQDLLGSIFVSPETEILISVFYSTLYFLKAGAKVGTFLIPTKCFQVFFMLKNILFRKYLILWHLQNNIFLHFSSVFFAIDKKPGCLH